MDELRLDRHVFASNATAYDTAWATYGWTPALEGARASRMEEEVPWGAHTARLDDPPRLWGPVDAVLAPDNLDRLGSAFLPVDGRFGWSLWGATGERVGSEWRVLTHTVLADRGELGALAVHPEGLLRVQGAPGWLEALAGEPFVEPRRLEPARVPAGEATTAAFRGDRLRELARLRDRTLEVVGGAGALAPLLAAAYEALAAALGPGHPGHVGFRAGGGDPRASLLVRLTWLGLPAADRPRVFYVTEQRRTERPRAHLLGLPAAEWGRWVPEDTWLAGEAEPVAAPSPGRRHWAELLADPARWDAFVDLDRRADARGWHLVAAEDLDVPAVTGAWLDRWRREGPSLAAVEDLVALEDRRGGAGRWRAVGAALAAAAGRAQTARPGRRDGGLRVAEAAFDVIRTASPAVRPALLRGLVRGLIRGGGDGVRAAGVVRCRAAAVGAPALARELHRLVDRESPALRALLADPRGAEVVLLGAVPLAAAGDPVGRELVRVAAPDVDWGAGAADALVTAVDALGPDATDVLHDVLEALVREGVPSDALEAAGAAVLPRVADATVDALLEHGAPPGLAFPLLLRASRANPRQGASVTAGLLERTASAVPPSRDPRPWQELLAVARGAWLCEVPVLSAVATALGAGREPWRAVPEEDPRARLASLVLRRVLERAGTTGLSEGHLTPLLRLLWLEGDGGTLNWLGAHHGDAAVGLLARLLAAPAPDPLSGIVREALARALDHGLPTEGAEDWLPALWVHAPALAARLPAPASQGRRPGVVRWPVVGTIRVARAGASAGQAGRP